MLNLQFQDTHPCFIASANDGHDVQPITAVRSVSSWTAENVLLATKVLRINSPKELIFGGFLVQPHSKTWLQQIDM